MLEKIKNRYDPENDTRPEAPPVTWAEMDLCEEVEKLAARVESLEKMRTEIIDALENHSPDNNLAQTIWLAVR